MSSYTCSLVKERCIACGLCAVYAPAIFDYDEEGIVLFHQEPEATHQYISENHYPSILKAYQKCPVRAILIEQGSNQSNRH